MNAQKEMKIAESVYLSLFVTGNEMCNNGHPSTGSILFIFKIKKIVTEIFLGVVHVALHFRNHLLASAYAKVMFTEIRFAKR